MRKQWTNFILHASALIHKKKSDLLVSHGIRTVYQLIVIVFLELWLAVISLPLYINIANEIDGHGYRIRRVITLSTLLLILFIWLIKISFIVVMPLYFDARQFFISSAVAPREEKSFILPEIYAAETDNGLSVPTVDDIFINAEKQLVITGKGAAGRQTVVNVNNIQSGENVSSWTKIYVSDIGQNGVWTIATNRDDFYLKPGEYSVQVMAYDFETNRKSQIKAAGFFELKKNLAERIAGKVDVYLNYLVMTILVIGIISIILLI